MPTLISQNETNIEWTDIERRVHHKRPKLKRSNGVHISGIIKHILTTTGYFTKEDASDLMPLRMALGMAFEDWIVGLWPAMKWQPGEKKLDGIFASPDGLTGDCLEEFKCTWKSIHTRPDILKEKVWMWQLAAYCKMMKLTRARLHVFWVNGSYRPPAPVYMIYELQFTQAELDQFWTNVILKNKDAATPEKHEATEAH